MTSAGSSFAAELRLDLIEALADPLRAQVLIAVAERPGATAAQVADRMGAPTREVRRHLDLLIETGLVAGDAAEYRRARRYRAVAMPTVVDQGDGWRQEDGWKIALSVVKQIVADVGRAIRRPHYGSRDGHSMVRIPGEVDERGWEELEETAAETMQRLEETMVASAARLEAAGEPGIEVISALLLFEGMAWDPVEGRNGPRPSPWLARLSMAEDPSATHLEADVEALPPELRAATFEALGEPLRAQVFASVAERPGATIAQVAARLEEPPRRIRHQVDRLLEAGLLVVSAETQRRNARERHYRVVAMPKVTETTLQTVAERCRISRSLTRHIVTDVGRAIRRQTFANRPGHSEIRVPGEVDPEGWDELAELVTATTERIEGTMIASAERLAAAGETGDEAIVALLLFETSAWNGDQIDGDGPRPSAWLNKSG